MPFKQDPFMQPIRERTIVQKETIIREKPIQVLNASLETLFVKHLRVPDITLFYPPEPHKLNNSFLDFSTNNSSVDLRINNAPFLTYSRNQLYTNNINVSTGMFDTLSVSNIRVGRIESSTNEIGGVFMTSGHLTVPGNLHIGQTFVAKEGSMGGVLFRNGKSAFTEVSTTRLIAERASISDLICSQFSSSQSSIDLAGVSISNGDIHANSVISDSDSCISGVRLHNCGIDCEFANLSMLHVRKIDIDSASISSVDDRLSMDVGIVTPPESINNIGCIRCDKSSLSVEGSLTVSSANIGHLSVQDIIVQDIRVGSTTIQPNGIHTPMITVGIADIPTLNTHHTTCARIDVTEEIRANDYKLSDGTSILKGVFPKHIIMLYHGDVPPRGWLLCDGRGGTPRLPSPTPGVIYIVRV